MCDQRTEVVAKLADSTPVHSAVVHMHLNVLKIHFFLDINIGAKAEARDEGSKSSLRTSHFQVHFYVLGCNYCINNHAVSCVWIKYK